MNWEQMKKATRQLCFGIFAWSIVVLLLVIIAVQAISNIHDGKWAGGFNYAWQPLGPGIQLSFVAASVVIMVLSVWQYFRSKGKRK
jgi:uncharacterized integral membrane protein